jgi:hypothetical protein
MGPWLMDHQLLWSTVDQKSGMAVGSSEDNRPATTARRRLPAVAGEGKGSDAVLTVGKKGRRRHRRGSAAKVLAVTVMTSSVRRLDRGGGKLGTQMGVV